MLHEEMLKTTLLVQDEHEICCKRMQVLIGVGWSVDKMGGVSD